MRRATRIAAASAGAAAAVCALPASALAHGVSERADVPVPEVVFAWAAAGVLVLSFIILALFWPKPKLEDDSWRPIGKGDPNGAQPAFWQVIDVFCGLVGFLLLVLVLWAGFDGTQTEAANIAPTLVYVVFWNGLAFASILLGDVFRAFNPWRAAATAVAWVASAISRGSLPEPLRYPERLGRLPAALGLTAFTVMELVIDDGNLPRNVAIGTAIYSVATWAGMALYGIDRWLERGESFNVYFGLFGRIAPFERRKGVLGVRKPLSGLTRIDAIPGTVLFVAVMIGTVTFDGLKEGQFFTGISPDLQDFFNGVGFDMKHSLELANLVGLLACVLVVWGFYELGAAGARSVGGGFGREELARKFVHTLVPIAFVYVAAHYLTQLLFKGQTMAYLASDPLGRGWDLFGGRDSGIDYGVIGATATWYWQVGFVVVGHVAALVLAHDRALVMYADARQAVRSQYWMLGVMVGFTCLALWLLSEVS